MGVLTKEVVIEKIEVLENGIIRTREKTRILEDGIIISRKYTNRKIIEPGQDCSKEAQRVKDIATAVHKPEIVSEYQAKVAAKLAEQESKETQK